MTNVELAMIISVYNRNDRRLMNCLRSLIRQNTQHHYDIFVVDYGSNDGLEAALQALGSEKINYAYVDKTPFNRSHANNIAVVNTAAPLVCMTDGYYIFQDNFIESIFTTAVPYAILTCTARPICIPQTYVESDDFDIVEQFDECMQKDGVGHGTMRGSTYVLAMDKDALIGIRGYDEEMLYGEDIDILRRMLVAGATLIRLDASTTVAYQCWKQDAEVKRDTGKKEQEDLKRSDLTAVLRRKSPMRNIGKEFGQL